MLLGYVLALHLANISSALRLETLQKLSESSSDLRAA